MQLRLILTSKTGHVGIDPLASADARRESRGYRTLRGDTLRRRAEDLARRQGVFAIYVDAKDPREGFDERPEWPHRVTGKSAVFAPGGELIAENAGNDEALVVVDIPPG